MKKPGMVVIGAAISVILIALFGIFQVQGSEFLKLPAQWLAVGILPLVVMLFVGGYITKFSGFGIELENALSAPVSTLDLTAAPEDITASDIISDIPGDEKRSTSYLDSLSEDKARSVRSLLFTTSRAGDYRAQAIARYLQRLPNIEFLEVRKDNKEIEGILPVRALRKADGGADIPSINRFIESLKNKNLEASFPDTAITLKVGANESLVEVLRKLRAARAEFAAVVSSSKRYMGIVLASEVERRIADSVLAAERA